MALSKYDIDEELVKWPGSSHTFMVELVGSNKRVLDVGCDTGYLGTVLQALGNRVSGFEVDPVTGEEAAKHLDRVVIGDLERTDLVEEFGAGSFDVVIFGDVLEHLRDPLPVLRQARPLLAPGGSVIISTPNIAHGDIRMALLQGKFDYTRVGILDDTHTRFFTRKTLVQFLTDAGFVLTELRRTQAELFETEVAIVESEIDPAVVAKLRGDPEATTYQFVLRAVPDDATRLDTEQALRIDDLSTELHSAKKELVALRAAFAELSEQEALARSELLSLQAVRTEVQRAHDQAVAERDEVRQQLRAANKRLASTSVTSRAVRSLRRKIRGY
ncbi:methyltransferase family protein [Jatrophihabitans sp. GAS493]|uniref:class I SAM-dependent methyltransferase n=1 Tax=Jatrophihabitans sp. GAS493 TaxID=1907575 RepID=UPI000BB95541|nr:class I SAM-dependent methyltransferase [Jatrophihabitans sp. GAS493]SOD70604.1 methyltransferase family protein [Jatrophihabitans sp. GAS493]